VDRPTEDIRAPVRFEAWDELLMGWYFQRDGHAQLPYENNQRADHRPLGHVSMSWNGTESGQESASGGNARPSGWSRRGCANEKSQKNGAISYRAMLRTACGRDNASRGAHPPAILAAHPRVSSSDILVPHFSGRTLPDRRYSTSSPATRLAETSVHIPQRLRSLASRCQT